MSDTSPNHATAIQQDLYCPHCAYNLRGLTGERCPECGESVADLRDPVSRIPWVHRSHLGWWRAYWRTVWFVMFQQKRFAAEMARPVSYKDAQLFRWVTVGAAYLAVLLGCLSVMVWPTRCPSNDDMIVAICTTSWIRVSLFMGGLFFLAAATGFPSYFFHPKTIPMDRQNRAIALSYYSCGPISLALLPTVFWLVGLHLEFDNNRGSFFALLSVFVGLGLFAVWWLDLMHLARKLFPVNPKRSVLVGLSVPMSWAFLCVVLMLGPVLLIGGVIVILRTLR